MCLRAQNPLNPQQHVLSSVRLGLVSKLRLQRPLMREKPSSHRRFTHRVNAVAPNSPFPPHSSFDVADLIFSIFEPRRIYRVLASVTALAAPPAPRELTPVALSTKTAARHDLCKSRPCSTLSNRCIRSLAHATCAINRARFSLPFRWHARAISVQNELLTALATERAFRAIPPRVSLLALFLPCVLRRAFGWTRCVAPPSPRDTRATKNNYLSGRPCSRRGPMTRTVRRATTSFL